MILSLNPELFESTDGEILKPLAAILRSEFADHHFIDIKRLFPVLFSAHGEYVFDDTLLAKDYLSGSERIGLKELFIALISQDVYITNLVRKYVPLLNIGLGANEYHPNKALKIVSEPARLVVENATNDWKFFQGIIDKYSRHPKRRSIYSLLKKAIDAKQLVAEQAGGKGQIKARLNDLASNRYEGIVKERLMTVFDSDRNNAISLNHEQKSIISFLKNGRQVELDAAINDDGDIVLWHMLYKREMENYVPVEALIEDGRLNNSEVNSLSAFTPAEIDFIDYDNFLENNPSISPKVDFPNLFLADWTRDKLESRCSHHKVNIELPNGTLEQVSEIEYLLLKIVRIV